MATKRNQAWHTIQLEVAAPADTTAAKIEEMMNRLAKKAVPDISPPFRNVKMIKQGHAMRRSVDNG